MKQLLLAVSVFALLAGCAQMPGTNTGNALPAPMQEPADPLVRQLRQGGYILYFRHGKTEQAFQDKLDKPGWYKSCDTRSSRPLSDEGRAQMMSIGNNIRELRIPVASVITSEYCRAFDSGLMLQLMPVQRSSQLNFPDAQRAEGRNDATISADMRALIATPPPPGSNVILIGHVHSVQPPIDPVFQQLVEGEVAVVKVGEKGILQIVGRIPVEKWAERVK